MRLTEEKINAINEAYAKSKGTAGVRIMNSIGGPVIISNKMNWMICDLQDIDEVINELRDIQEVIKEETGICW